MKEIIQGKDGKMSGSKFAYMTTLIVMLVKVLAGGVTFGDFTMVAPDYTGMGVFLAAVGSVYAYRNHDTKKEDK